MADILIRGVPEEIVDRLKKRAAARGVSLQSELKELLVQSAGADMRRVLRFAARMRKELAGRPQSDSTELIREDRDR